MTQELAIAILEGLKDHIDDDGKRELSSVIKAIGSWIIVREPEEIPNPAPEVVKIGGAVFVEHKPSAPKPRVVKKSVVAKKKK